jgi:metal-responsive CopG/Arc/MetJ family transcriptional regulator
MRMGIDLNHELSERLQRTVPAPDINEFVNQAIEHALRVMEQHVLAEMREGYLAVHEHRNTVAEEWAAADLEGWP